MIELSDVAFVKLIRFGGGPDEAIAEQRREAAVALLNRCLTDIPRGRIIAIEKDVVMRGAEGQAAVAQAVTYHIGFPRRPAWLSD